MSQLPLTIVRLLARRWLSPSHRSRLYRASRRVARPAWLGTLRCLTPLSGEWGFDRGTPVDRYYIEQFLETHWPDIRGHALEVKDSQYCTRFGLLVDRTDVLDIAPSNPRATIVADLAHAGSIASDQFDCFVLTQTLQLIYDIHAAVAHAHRILRPGGVLLATVPTTSRVVPRWGLEGDYWRFTAATCTRLFGDVFGPEQVRVQSFGNVLTSVAFLMGMAAEELSTRELNTQDPYFPLLIGVRAQKSEA